MPRPPKCITVEEARSIHNNWVATRARDIEQAMGIVDARDFFCTVAEMREYLDYVTKLSEEAGILNPGLRIFFSAYTNAASNKATVFVAPTSGSTNLSPINYDIDPYNSMGNGNPPTIY